MKHILLPTDFSDNSWNAIQYAITLFKDERCTFHLLNTYIPVVYTAEFVLGYPAQLELGDVIKNTSINNLNAFSERLSETLQKNSKHTFKTVSRFDYLISGIKEFISQNDTYLIVMGTKGATGANEVLFGSNTVHVFKEIKCPILAIPSGFEYQKPRQILFPTDLQIDFDTEQLEVLKQMVKAHHSKVNALHVSMGKALTSRQKNSQSQLKEQFADAFFLFHHYESRTVTAAIDSFQTTTDVNLLVMINNKQSFFENIFFKSTINQIGFHINVPFLVIPATH
ncbi:universal stress protein [Bizionia gelidisalsuginis]|uniref:Universal stress protein n=2 Tax=Bizionia TaxID=283785 RepID=A0A8H2QDZ5_9FLAO|nr:MULTISPECIES: universal stress protein [Bizionia]TYB72554.1 universal stress protein [Bizionia saleffrena]TYC09174.1 universal stress protein [Bizionia gelidisalsuginis]